MRRATIILLALVLILAEAGTAYAATGKSPFISTTYTHSSSFNGMNVYNGIDVSEHQYVINWPKVRNAGVDYAIIRCGYRGGSAGSLVTDNYFERNIKGALDNGIPVGIYFFSQALTVTEARKEADYVINLISGYDVSLPVFIDFEYQPGFRMNSIIGTTSAKKTKATNNIIAFIDEMKSAGYEAGVYASTNCYNTNMYPEKIDAAGGVFWIAQYNTSCTYTKTPYSAWQYTSSGSVSGISGRVDCNFWYEDDEYFELSKPPQVYGISQSAKSDTSISLKWTKAADVEEYHIYRASSAGGEYVEIGTSDTNTYKDTGLAFNKSYYYKVSASNSAGTGLMSSCFKAATVSVPSKVTGLVQTGKVKDTVTISWTGNSDADSYNIYRASSAGGKYTLSGTSKKNSFTDSGLKVKTAYYYKVEAVNGAGTGEKSDALKAETISETGKVTGIVRTARTRSTITFKWTADENAEGYYVYRSNAYNGTYSRIATVTSNTYKDTGRTAGRSYYYKIKAYNMLGEGTVSGIQTLTSLPKTDRYGTVTVTSAVIYKRAGSSFSKLLTVTKGEVLTIYASTVDINGKTWYKVIRNGVTGYIRGTDVTIQRKVTTLYSLNLRKGPSTSYASYGTVPAGVLRVVKETRIKSGETWYKVTYKIKGVSRTGWICGYTKTSSYVKAKNL